MPRTLSTNYSAQVIHGEYYPHIDGIRALAVLPVVLFHVLAALCPGGFAGVDVFFVISGYLITGGILRDLKKDRFTILDFYYRRIRRIMPAYFAMIAGVFVVGCAIYYSRPLVQLGDASVAGTLFLANLFFWKQGGNYFAQDIHTNPLLHLWSLSVEEQFYLFIPLLCAIVWNLRQRIVAPIFALLALFSLAGAVYAVANGKQNNAFYLLHFRAWELLVGSLLAMLPVVCHSLKSYDSRIGQLKAQVGPAFLATVGFLMVVITYVAISAKTLFPGATALSPVIGTALLIRYGGYSWISRLLSSPPAVGIGKISYSLYLWHWPVTVFWKYAVYDQLFAYDYIGMVLLSLMLAYLSWRFVEMPFRMSRFWSKGRSFAFVVTGCVLLVSVSAACVMNFGWPKVLHPKANEWIMFDTTQTMPLTRIALQRVAHLLGSEIATKYCAADNIPFSCGLDASQKIGANRQPEVLLLGDSHAGSLQYGLDIALARLGIGGYVVSCSATDMFDLDNPKCQEAITILTQHPEISKVVLVQFWSSRDNPSTYVKLRAFAVWVKAMGKTLYIATDVPIWKVSPNSIMAKMRIITPRKIEADWLDGHQTEEEYDRYQGDINRKLEKICHNTGAVLIPMHRAFSQNNYYIAFDQKNALYRDAGHLSPDGSLRAAQFVMPYLNEALTRRLK